MTLKYKCLILDHDDTSVNSSSVIHYPAHLEIMRKLRPNNREITLDEWFAKNSDPGVMEFYLDELKFNNEEMKQEHEIWRKYNTDENINPEFYPGIIDALKEYKKKKGIVTVVSHSEKDIIERHYLNGNSFMPNLIFGWDDDKNKRKPSPYPIFRAIENFKDEGVRLENVLVIDDLKPGAVMAKNANVNFVASGWAHNIKAIENYMKKISLAYFKTVPEFREFILQEK